MRPRLSQTNRRCHESSSSFYASFKAAPALGKSPTLRPHRTQRVSVARRPGEDLTRNTYDIAKTSRITAGHGARKVARCAARGNRCEVCACDVCVLRGPPRQAFRHKLQQKRGRQIFRLIVLWSAPAPPKRRRSTALQRDSDIDVMQRAAEAGRAGTRGQDLRELFEMNAASRRPTLAGQQRLIARVGGAAARGKRARQASGLVGSDQPQHHGLACVQRVSTRVDLVTQRER